MSISRSVPLCTMLSLRWSFYKIGGRPSKEIGASVKALKYNRRYVDQK